MVLCLRIEEYCRNRLYWNKNVLEQRTEHKTSLPQQNSSKAL